MYTYTHISLSDRKDNLTVSTTTTTTASTTIALIELFGDTHTRRQCVCVSVCVWNQRFFREMKERPSYKPKYSSSFPYVNFQYNAGWAADFTVQNLIQ